MASPSGKDRFLERLSRCRRANLDTNIFIYYLEDEPSRSELVAGLFRLVFEGTLQALASAIVQMELLAKAIKTNDLQSANRVIELTELRPQIEIVDVSRPIVMEAALARAEGLEVADSIVLATGTVAECDVTITNDKRWRNAVDRLSRRPLTARGERFLDRPPVLCLDEYAD
ncbi:MAG: PIN domain-containing protein [Dehalococcoidia bacterium]